MPDSESVPPDRIKCFITGKLRKNTPEEQVRQVVARSLVEEYGYKPKDMDVEFSDYLKLISLPDNWENFFKDVFPSMGWIETRLNDINQVRRKCMHSRRISKHDLDKLNVAIREVLRLCVP